MFGYLILFVLGAWSLFALGVYIEDKSRYYRVQKRNDGRRKVHGIL